MEYIENSVSQLKKSIGELKKQIDDFMADFANGQQQNNSSVDEKWVKDLESELKRLKAEMQKFKDDTTNTFNVVNETLERKADKEDLLDLEQRLLAKINEILNKLLG